MPANLELSCVEILPATTAVGSVIWMHGLGASGNDFAPIIPELNLPATLPVRFIFPNAPQRPVTVNNGYVMPAWYDITSFGLNQQIDYAGMNHSAKQIDQVIQQEIDFGIPSEKIIIAGFSQGAVMALSIGVHSNKQFGGILALSGYLPYSPEMLKKQISPNQATPIFMGHGASDTVVPYQAGLMACDTLKNAKFNVQWHSYPIAHSVNATEINDISRWLQNIYQ